MADTLEVVGIEFDTRQLDAAVKQAVQGQDQLEKSIDQSAEAAKRAQATFNETVGSVTAYASATRLTAEEISAAEAKYAELFGATEDLNEVHAEAIRWNQHFDQVLRAEAKTMDEAHAEALRMNVAFDEQNRSVFSNVQGLGRLNNTLASVARQAAGVHPAIGQIVNALSGLALGAGSTTAVLLFLAALAAGWRKVNEAEREANEATEKRIELLDELAQRQGSGPVPGAIRDTEAIVADLERQQKELEGKIDFNMRRGLFDTASRQTEELFAVLSQLEEERARLNAGVVDQVVVLPGIDVSVEGRGAQRERSEARRRELAIRNMQADLAEIDRAEKEAAAAKLEHEDAVRKLNQQLELEHIQLTQGEAAAFRASLAMQGWTEAEIRAAESAFVVNQALREQQVAADELAKNQLRELQEEAEQAEQEFRRMADGITDAFFDVIQGTDSVAEAVADMVDSIASQLAREEIADFLFGLFTPSPKFSSSEIGAAIDVSEQITPDFGSVASMSAPKEIHYHTVNLSLNAVDGQSAAQFLEANKGAIARVVIGARRDGLL